MKNKLSSIASVRIGYQSRGSIEAVENGPFRIIQPKDISKNGSINWNSIVSFLPEREPWRYVVRPGDLLFLARGRNNLAIVVDVCSSLDCPIVALGSFYIVETSEKVNPKYLAWFINLPQTQVLIRSKAQATSISLVTKANFEELKIELPALSIQNKIVELDDLQKKECALLRALAEKKEILVSAICICAVKRNSK